MSLPLSLSGPQDAAVGGRDFAARLDTILSDLVGALPESFSHPLLEPRKEVKKRKLLIISGERGLCGAFNSSVIKAIAADLEKDDVETEVVCFGRRTILGVKSLGLKMTDGFEGLGENVSEWPILDVCEGLAQEYIAGEIDEVQLYYTKFKSAVTQEVTKEALIPFSQEKLQREGSTKAPKTDPVASAIVSSLIPTLIQSQVTQAAMESKASEHAARMTAMDAATTNATELIGKLKLHYNRARQSAITTELIDIVGGAEATN